MILVAALLWLAAGYRIWLTATRPRTIWRTSFMIGMVAASTSFTTWLVGPQFDALVGVRNLAGLLTRIVLVVGLGFTCVYVDALRRSTMPRGHFLMQLGVAGAVVLIMLTSWLLSRIHDREQADLMGLAGQRSVVVYCVAFWAYVSAGLVQIARVCLARGRTFRRDDPARSVALFMIGLAALLALPVMTAWTIAIIAEHFGLAAVSISGIGDAIIPFPMLMLTVGVLALVAVPWLMAAVRATAHLVRLAPLWRAMVDQQPGVHLKGALAGGPLTRLRTAEARAIVEIRDALRMARIEAEVPASLEAVASALRRDPCHGKIAAADLLAHVDSREADTRQILLLADAYKAARP